ncbi:MAG: hypothetical protein OXC71_07060 [Chloroflexi bacterium]|nr:hypothetical protein [Chloroflexota bacterium]
MRGEREVDVTDGAPGRRVAERTADHPHFDPDPVGYGAGSVQEMLNRLKDGSPE